MAQTSFGRRGRFCPTRRPLFHGVRKGLLFELISIDMVDLHARPLHRIALVQRTVRCTATAQTGRAEAATANGGSRSESCRRRYGKVAHKTGHSPCVGRLNWAESAGWPNGSKRADRRRSQATPKARTAQSGRRRFPFKNWIRRIEDIEAETTPPRQVRARAAFVRT